MPLRHPGAFCLRSRPQAPQDRRRGTPEATGPDSIAAPQAYPKYPALGAGVEAQGRRQCGNGLLLAGAADVPECHRAPQFNFLQPLAE